MTNRPRPATFLMVLYGRTFRCSVLRVYLHRAHALLLFSTCPHVSVS